MKKNLHLVTFDVPYPPNYGGVIDIFYKVVELSKLGVSIYLHTFLYDDKTEQKELEKYCEKVFYYPRKNNFLSLFSFLPMRVKSRSNNTLNENLKSIVAPILFEGLHSIHSLYKENFSQKTYVRTHNIEHFYFYGLAKSEQSLLKKCFFYFEGYKLKKFEKQLHKTDGIFTISPAEQEYFSKNYGEKSIYIPAFHRSDFKQHKTQKGKVILWHGDLRVSDNVRVANELVKMFKNTKHALVIASSFEDSSVISNIKSSENAVFENISEEGKLDTLLEKAHVNVLLTHQKTGIKLKLLYSLYQGKFIIVNDKMIEDTGLESLCEEANTPEEILAKTTQLFKQDFTSKILEERTSILEQFSPTVSAKKIIDVIFS